MSGDQLPGDPVRPDGDDAVVPHPLGPAVPRQAAGPPPDAPAAAGPPPDAPAAAGPPPGSLAPGSGTDAAPEPAPVASPEPTGDVGPDEAAAVVTERPDERAPEPRSAAAEPAAAEPAAAEPAAAEPAAAEPAATEPAAAEPAATEPAAEPEGTPPASDTAGGVPRRRRDPLAAVLIGLLTMALGFAFAVQVRTVGEDTQLAGAREEDLVRILDELDAQEERLRDQLAEQRTALEQLTNSDSQAATALEEARERAEAISILNGTVAAQGPGLRMVIRDPDDEVQVADLLDAIQELRGAGAETMQIDDVRVGVSTAVTGEPGGLMVDGRPITAPYEFLVIGSSQDMATAMSIPGGVVQSVNNSGGSVEITQLEEVVVDALRPLDTPQYASPDTDD